MRILHLSWEYPPLVYGGLGRHVHALAEAQAAAGHDVVVITQHPGDAGLAWGWLVCAVLFLLMGGLPLILVLPWVVRSFTGKAGPGRMTGPGVRAAVSRLSTSRRAAAAPASLSGIRPPWRTPRS